MIAPLTEEGMRVERDAVADALWQDIIEKDDRTSPAECPDMALITWDEFRSALTDYVAYSPERDLRALDAIWEKVNALGGYVGDTDAEGRARADVIDHVLEIIEKAGGMDPLRRRAVLAKATERGL